MPTSVVNVRTLLRLLNRAQRFPALYVGRAVPGCFGGHALANPFRIPHDATLDQRRDCLARYIEWLDALPDRDERLERLADQVATLRLPLGCWCGNWPEEPELVCHAVELARRVDEILNRRGAA